MKMENFAHFSPTLLHTGLSFPQIISNYHKQTSRTQECVCIFIHFLLNLTCIFLVFFVFPSFELRVCRKSQNKASITLNSVHYASKFEHTEPKELSKFSV